MIRILRHRIATASSTRADYTFPTLSAIYIPYGLPYPHPLAHPLVPSSSPHTFLILEASTAFFSVTFASCCQARELLTGMTKLRFLDMQMRDDMKLTRETWEGRAWWARLVHELLSGTLNRVSRRIYRVQYGRYG